jgi:MscS family membrane protein
MKIFLFLLLFAFAFLASADAEYTKFVDAQLELVYEMNEDNVTQEKIESLIEIQNLAYEKALDVLMANKADFLNSKNLFDSEMFSLKKIMSINQRAGNAYAALRDEIKLKSYMVSRNQNLMIKEILLALDAPGVDAFEEKLNKAAQKNQAETQELYEKDYAYLNEVESSSSTIIQAKKNLREFYALKDMNVDMINNIYKLENKMYRLNKYTKYHLIGAVIYINNAPVVKDVNPILEDYGLSVVKLALIAILVLLIHFFRKTLNYAIKSYMVCTDPLIF